MTGIILTRTGREASQDNSHYEKGYWTFDLKVCIPCMKLSKVYQSGIKDQTLRLPLNCWNWLQVQFAEMFPMELPIDVFWHTTVFRTNRQNNAISKITTSAAPAVVWLPAVGVWTNSLHCLGRKCSFVLEGFSVLPLILKHLNDTKSNQLQVFFSAAVSVTH